MQCIWFLEDGVPCGGQAMQGSDSCGSHDPNGKFALQHPAHRARLLKIIASGPDRTFITRNNAKAKGKCPAVTKKGLPCPNVGRSEDDYLCHLHKPDGKFALQHPEYRARLTQLPA